MDVLFDLYLNSICSAEHIEMEKRVVTEEINMYEDTPDEQIHDIYSSTIWANHKLGMPILGKINSIQNISRDNLLAFKEHYFNPKNVIISVAGKIEDKKKLIKLVTKSFSELNSNTKPFASYNSNTSQNTTMTLKNKKIEQIHFCLGTEGVSFGNPDHYKITLLSTLLGGSMSSRLFQKIRENKGWAYSIYTYVSFYKQSGLFTVYAGINKNRFKQSVAIILREFEKLRDKKITSRELSKVKEQLKGNLVLSLERSSSWMNWLGRSEIYFNRIYTVDDIIERIESVTTEDLQDMAKKHLQNKNMALAAIGPFNKKDESQFESLLPFQTNGS